MKKKGFLIEKGEVIAYLGNTDVQELKIPSGVKVISSYCKIGIKHPIKIVIPKSVEKICDNAFAGCVVSEVVFEEGSNLKEIGEYFASGEVQTLKIPDSVLIINPYAFAKLTYENLELPKRFENEEYFKLDATKIINNNNKKSEIIVEPMQTEEDKKKTQKYKNSKYKDWSQSQLISAYTAREVGTNFHYTHTILGVVLSTIIWGAVGFGICWLLSKIGNLLENVPSMWYWFTGLFAGIGLCIGIWGYLFNKKQEEIEFFIKDHSQLNKALSSAFQDKIEEYKRNKENYKGYSEYEVKRAEEREMKEMAQNISEINDSLKRSAERSSSSTTTYDVYDENGNHIGKIDKR